MNFNHRIRRLESALRPEPGCSGCGFPQTGVFRVTLADRDAALPECKVCGRPLDEGGAPLHTPFTHIILR